MNEATAAAPAAGMIKKQKRHQVIGGAFVAVALISGSNNSFSSSPTTRIFNKWAISPSPVYLVCHYDGWPFTRMPLPSHRKSLAAYAGRCW
ncbi:MAG: hypothetical protein M3N13_11065, partial [Candidatus Eremiobacteraeota bacterium]|nr:hypothetical protein [Candidatus Eremiobacteraeota bacterium]